jgi:hypothetical protein
MSVNTFANLVGMGDPEPVLEDEVQSITGILIAALKSLPSRTSLIHQLSDNSKIFLYKDPHGSLWYNRRLVDGSFTKQERLK